jgi:hypothetical protein
LDGLMSCALLVMRGNHLEPMLLIHLHPGPVVDSGPRSKSLS